jgi:hypothetical protein
MGYLAVFRQVIHAGAHRRDGRVPRETVPQPMNELQEYLGRVSTQWDQVLSRLKTLVES